MAAKQGRELVKEAVRDAKALREVSLAAAKNELIEQLSPSLRALIERQLDESVDRVNSQGADYYSPSSREKEKKFQEGKDKGEEEMADDKDNEKELDLESLAGMFPQLSEDPDPDPDPKAVVGDEEMGMHLAGEHGEEEHPEAPPAHAKHEDADPDADPNYEGMQIPKLGEDADPDADPDPKMEGKDKEKEEMDEELEIDENQLRQVYESALQVEAQVSKGFKDMVGGGELDQAHKETGILDKKSGEKGWEKEVPPDHVDYQIKEGKVRAIIEQGLAENKMLRGKLKEAVTLIKKLSSTLHETNLFNSKVLHVNRILNSPVRLTKEQKAVVLESIDQAKSVAQVKMVYETIVRSFNASRGTVNESKTRRPAGNAQRPRTSGAPKPEVLRESVDRASGARQYDRMAELAGLLK